MSRIGRRVITVPKAASVALNGTTVSVKGPKGSLSMDLVPGISLRQDDAGLHIERSSDERSLRAMHGLMRNLVSNMVTGVTTGFSRTLEIRGVGYRAEVSGRVLNLTLGYSHPIAFEIPAGVDIAIDKQTKVTVTGIDKQLVGAVAAKIREFRTPDIYKGKGVRYIEEDFKLKPGKSGGK